MRTWSQASQKVYDELTPGLQRFVARMRDEVCDVKLLCGHRGQEEQDLALATGNSKLAWPHGKHNRLPSTAVDMQPSPAPSGWQLHAALGYMAGRGRQIAKEEGIAVRWGGDWDSDGDLSDQAFNDLYHWEELDK